MNNITLNWSAEDRARIDKLIALLEQCAASKPAETYVEEVIVEPEDYDTPKGDEIPGQVTVHELVAEMPQEAPEPVEQEQAPQEDETTQNEPTVTKQDILQKVIALCGAGKKAEAKDIITTYADSVSDLPDEALAEVWDKLTALEG